MNIYQAKEYISSALNSNAPMKQQASKDSSIYDVIGSFQIIGWLVLPWELLVVCIICLLLQIGPILCLSCMQSVVARFHKVCEMLLEAPTEGYINIIEVMNTR